MLLITQWLERVCGDNVLGVLTLEDTLKYLEVMGLCLRKKKKKERLYIRMGTMDKSVKTNNELPLEKEK